MRVETGCSSQQLIERIGGASRDRTDDLIVANDGVRQPISFIRRFLAVDYGPLRSNSTPTGCRSLPQLFSAWFELFLIIVQPLTSCSQKNREWNTRTWYRATKAQF
jgi:hypothetical protein